MHRPPPASGAHIVDTLIEERAPGLSASWAWPMVRPLLLNLLGYRQARAMADAVAPMSGQEALAHVAAILRLKIEAIGLDRLPRAGRVVVAINHPTGLADGVAALEAIRPVRPDVAVFANADALRVCPRLSEAVIPVEWVDAKRTREKTRQTLELAVEALRAERPLLIAPAGRIARQVQGGFAIDPPWQATAVSLARRHGAPLLPVHIAGPPSTLFRLFARISPELRDITLFHEMLNKRGGRFRLTFGAPIPPDALGGDPQEVTRRLKTYVERTLPVHPDAPFA